MNYDILIRKKAEKNLKKLLKVVRKLFFLLIEDLKADGAIQKSGPNFSALDKNKYHCHLNYGYVACWVHDKRTIVIEVYYVGNREKAPY